MLQYGDMSQNHLLSHGDIVYVPNSSNNKIYIMGEVGKQATLPIGNHGLNLTQALGEVGGMNQNYADANRRIRDPPRTRRRGQTYPHLSSST